LDKRYSCFFEMDYRSGDVFIQLKGDGQEIRFMFMIGFFSIPSFLFLLLRLWNGKTDKFEIDGFGYAVTYYFSLREKRLFVEQLIYNDNGQPITQSYLFDFEKFVKAIDRGFSIYVQEQYDKGILPLEKEEHTHPLSQQVLKEYGEFSAIINKK